MREQQLLLRRDDHRGVDAEQRLAGPDRLAGEVHEQLAHPPVDQRRDGLDPGLVVGHLSHGTHRAIEWRADHGPEGDADPALLAGSERHRHRLAGR
jgi:hypothetical protein